MSKVMLVEDDNNLREIYEARLIAEGYDIVSAKDGEEALVIAKAEKPDLIISDVMMPKISGFEMLDILRNTEGLKDVKVIMLTALGQSDDQQRADRLGADRYLVKSQVTLEDIVKVTHDLLEDGTPLTDTPPSVPETPVPSTPASTDSPTAAPPVIDAPQAAPSTTPVPPTSSSTPDATVSASPADAAAVTTPPAAPAAVTPTDPAAASDDILMADAVDKLLANGEEDSEPADPVAAPATAPLVQPAPSTDASEPSEPVAQTPASASTNPDESTSDSPPEAPAPEPAPVVPAPAPEVVEPVSDAPDTAQVAIAHKKVITPLDDTGKKDIGALLAVEEAKEAANQPPAPPTAIIATAETGQKEEPLTAEVPPPTEPAPEDAPAEEPPAPEPESKNDGAAQTTAEEEAVVEAKIEDFVSGASTDAPAPLPTTAEIAPTTPTDSSATNTPSVAPAAPEVETVTPTATPSTPAEAAPTPEAEAAEPPKPTIGKVTSATAPAEANPSPPPVDPAAPPAASAITAQANVKGLPVKSGGNDLAPDANDPNSIAL